jgi:hypothetical protein
VPRWWTISVRPKDGSAPLRYLTTSGKTSSYVIHAQRFDECAAAVRAANLQAAALPGWQVFVDNLLVTA